MVQTIYAVKEANEKVIGLKQTLRAILQDKVLAVYIANDVEEHVVRKVSDSCRDKGIPIIPANLSQSEFGRFCQIEVGAAVVAIIK